VSPLKYIMSQIGGWNPHIVALNLLSRSMQIGLPQS